MEDFVGAKFYCPHALADGNQCIQIREKTLEFCSTLLRTPSPYLDVVVCTCRLDSVMAVSSVWCRKPYRGRNITFGFSGPRWKTDLPSLRGMTDKWLFRNVIDYIRHAGVTQMTAVYIYAYHQGSLGSCEVLKSAEKWYYWKVVLVLKLAIRPEKVLIFRQCCPKKFIWPAHWLRCTYCYYQVLQLVFLRHMGDWALPCLVFTVSVIVRHPKWY